MPMARGNVQKRTPTPGEGHPRGEGPRTSGTALGIETEPEGDAVAVEVPVRRAVAEGVAGGPETGPEQGGPFREEKGSHPQTLG